MSRRGHYESRLEGRVQCPVPGRGNEIGKEEWKKCRERVARGRGVSGWDQMNRSKNVPKEVKIEF